MLFLSFLRLLIAIRNFVKYSRGSYPVNSLFLLELCRPSTATPNLSTGDSWRN